MIPNKKLITPLVFIVVVLVLFYAFSQVRSKGLHVQTPQPSLS